MTALPPPPDRYRARGRVRLVAGWQAVAQLGQSGRRAAEGERGKRGEVADGDGGPTLPPLAEGQRLDGKLEVVTKQTRPPPRHTEATLLGAMESAGRDIADEELRAAMRDSGLGTPATRAATIETLIRRTFVARDGKNLVPTDMGIGLIDALPEKSLASPELTGSWEARLSRMARGEETRAAFMADISRYVSDVVTAIRGGAGVVRASGTPRRAPATAARRTTRRPRRRARSRRPPSRAAGKPRPPPTTLTCPLCKQGTLVAGKRGWGCTRWREGCAFVIWFEIAGRRITDAELTDLVSKGKTRKRKWRSGEGARDRRPPRPGSVGDPRRRRGAPRRARRALSGRRRAPTAANASIANPKPNASFAAVLRPARSLHDPHPRRRPRERFIQDGVRIEIEVPDHGRQPRHLLAGIDERLQRRPSAVRQVRAGPAAFDQERGTSLVRDPAHHRRVVAVRRQSGGTQIGERQRFERRRRPHHLVGGDQDREADAVGGPDAGESQRQAALVAREREVNADAGRAPAGGRVAAADRDEIAPRPRVGADDRLIGAAEREAVVGEPGADGGARVRRQRHRRHRSDRHRLADLRGAGRAGAAFGRSTPASTAAVVAGCLHHDGRRRPGEQLVDVSRGDRRGVERRLARHRDQHAVVRGRPGNANLRDDVGHPTADRDENPLRVRADRPGLRRGDDAAAAGARRAHGGEHGTDDEEQG